jgi:hypothetical protein
MRDHRVARMIVCETVEEGCGAEQGETRGIGGFGAAQHGIAHI